MTNIKTFIKWKLFIFINHYQIFIFNFINHIIFIYLFNNHNIIKIFLIILLYLNMEYFLNLFFIINLYVKFNLNQFHFQIIYILNLLLFKHPLNLLSINMEPIYINYYIIILLFLIFILVNLFIVYLFFFLFL